MVVAVLLFTAACHSSHSGGLSQAPGGPGRPLDVLPGMPPVVDTSNVYSEAGPNMLSDAVQGHRELVYVPNTVSNDVTVIDPKAFEVVATFPGGPEPQHVVPGYDMRTIYVGADKVPTGGITPIDPTTGKPRPLIPVQDVYNLYFTPDGKSAIVVAEFYKRLDFYDPSTWRKQSSVSIPDCGGINHMDFTADGRKA